MKPASPTHNLHTVAMAAGILCVECNTCRRRTALEGLGRQGDMRPLVRLKLKCRDCGSTDVSLSIPNTWDEAKTWLSG